MQVRRIATDQLRTFAGAPRQLGVPVPVDRPDRPIALERPGRPPVQVEPKLRNAPGLRFITVPPPGCVAMYTACGGISATSPCQYPDAAFEPNRRCPLAHTRGDPTPGLKRCALQIPRPQCPRSPAVKRRIVGVPVPVRRARAECAITDPRITDSRALNESGGSQAACPQRSADLPGFGRFSFRRGASTPCLSHNPTPRRDHFVPTGARCVCPGSNRGDTL